MSSMPGPGTARALWRTFRNALLGSASALGAFALAASPGCGTSAEGVGDCREIEQARCVAAASCGIVTDVEECKLYYRDHCLHGLPQTPPAPAMVDECVSTIQALGRCADAHGGKNATLEACDPPVAARNATRACEVVQYPERAYACSFLAGKPVSPGAAGQAGQAGSGDGG